MTQIPMIASGSDVGKGGFRGIEEHLEDRKGSRILILITLFLVTLTFFIFYCFFSCFFSCFHLHF